MIRTLAVAAVLTFSNLAYAELLTDANSVRSLPAGIAAPDAAITTLAGKATTLHAQLAGKPSVLVFYRGGWCPYCNLQLSELRKLGPMLTKNGFQMLAISPDSPASLTATMDKSALEYTLLSDSSSALMQAFGIGFTVDAKTIKKYAEYGVDLEKSSGQKHHVLPVPSVYVIDAAGIVQFSYSNPDYSTRVPGKLVEAAVEAVASGDAGKRLQPKK